MSLTTKAIGAVKKLKHSFDAQIKAREKVYLSPVRRIERVATHCRVAAMTFDDGPCRLPASPSEDTTPLTERLCDTLEKYGARGTFDVVGDTSGNYPDRAGKEGSAEWGGIKYDHYPDFGKDSDGGAVSCPELISRILAGGHEITGHTYSHVLFGPKRPVYGSRDPLPNIDAVLADLRRLDEYMKNNFDYKIKLSRPPHYVDKMKDSFSSYDAYAIMGYQYMAASFDGAGWLPLADYGAEVEAVWRPVERELSSNEDYFCGQIIFHKDGFNMARRSPVADGLERQLELLSSRGYKIVTVSELLDISPFADVCPEDGVFSPARRLLEDGWCVCFRDNTVRPSAPLTRGELAMMANGCRTVEARLSMVRGKASPAADVSPNHPYAAAIKASVENGELKLTGGRFREGDAVTAEEFSSFCKAKFEIAPVSLPRFPITHGDAIRLLSELAEN